MCKAYSAQVGKTLRLYSTSSARPQRVKSRAIWYQADQPCPTRKGESAADRRWHSRQMSQDIPDGSRSRAPRTRHL